jgi:transcriptional regulator with XRE-family HTH domain
MESSEATRIKRKMQGVLIRAARTRAGLASEETAELLGLPSATLTGYELGQQEASLPEFEAMARLFDVPVSYFWSGGISQREAPVFKAEKIIAIRRKMIGVLLRQARQKAGKEAQQVAQEAGCTLAQLEAYELGKQDIAFSQLETLAGILGVRLDYFMGGQEEPASNGAVSAAKQETAPAPVPTPAGPAAVTVGGTAEPEWLQNLPDDVKTFMEDPSSLLYLKLSMSLHRLSAKNLRALAEGILDITY